MHAGSLQPYLSAINQWHADMGFERPAVGHVIQRLRRGFGELEGADDGEAVACRRPIPASVMFKILRLASSLRRNCSHRSRLLRRACTASALAFGFMLRAVSLVQLRRRDVTVSAEGLVLSLQVKTRSRSISTTVHRPGTDELYLLIKDWLSDCPSLPCSSLWALDSSSDGSFSSSCSGHWFQEACSALGLSPPVGELWSGHSHRSGGATAALSVDASLPANPSIQLVATGIELQI